MASSHEDLDTRLLHRLLFFTDAVFAIVMTLLVLELKAPAGATLRAQLLALAGMEGRLAAFALSFAIAAIFWVAHMSTTRRLLYFDWPTATANLVFLFPICLIPFVSGWVGESAVWGANWGTYCVVLIATSAANILLVLVTSRESGRLLAGGMTSEERRYRVARAACPGIAFAVGLAAVVTGQALAAQLCWVLIPVSLRLTQFLKPRGETDTRSGP